MITLVSKRVINICLIIAILILSLGSLMTFIQYQNLFRVNAGIETSYRTIRAANQAIISLNESSLKVSNYLLGADTESINNLDETLIAAQVNFNVVGQLIQDNDLQKNAFRQVTPLFMDKINFLNEIIKKYKAGDRLAALQLESNKKRITENNQITPLIMEIKKEELRQLDANHAIFYKDVVDANGLFATFSMLSSILLILCLFRLNRKEFSDKRKTKR